MKSWFAKELSISKKFDLILTMNLKEVQLLPGILIGFWNTYYINIGIHWLVFAADITYTFKEQKLENE